MLTQFPMIIRLSLGLIVGVALIMAGGALILFAPDIAAAIGHRRGMRRWWARVNLTDLSDDQWLAELARMRIERSDPLSPGRGRDWDPPGAELAAWLEGDQLWPGDPRRPPS